MCEQCLAEMQLIVSDVLPEFALYRATKDGGRLKSGDYGLVECNDPSFIFNVVPEAEPNEENDSWIEWAGKANAFEDQLLDSTTDFKGVYRLIRGCYENGYKDEDGHVGMWLFNYLATKIIPG